MAASLTLAAGAAASVGDPHLAADTTTATPAQLDRIAARFQASLGAGRIQALAPPNAHLVGDWSALQAWPMAPQNATLLPNGNVLAYESASADTPRRTPAMIWNPATGTITRVDSDTGYNLFCSGFAHLPDGRIFIAGGDLDYTVNGLIQTHTFSPATESWALGPDMTQGDRWYPGVTPLPNGEMFIAEGGPSVPEVRTTAGTIRPLTNVNNAMSGREFPWLTVAPNGRVAFVGPRPNMWSIDTAGAGSISFAGDRDGIYRNYGSFAMFDIGKVLVVGGGTHEASARVVDLNTATPVVSATGSLATGRRQVNATTLADGSVLATGGISSAAEFADLAAAATTPELWNPATGTWSTMAPEASPRQYHSVALLLADGRVLSAGGGASCGECVTEGYLARNAQVFSPPYLFKKDGSGELAVRPTITSAPTTLGYGQAATVVTPDAAGIQKVGLVRMSSVTHSANTEQRYVPLAFTTGTGSLQITGPVSANVAPPGDYMLFIVDAGGVPSVSATIRVGPTTPVAPPAAPSLLTTAPGGGRVGLTWGAVAGATGYTVKYGQVGAPLGDSVDAGAGTSFTVTGLTDGVPYHFAVAARNGGGTGPNSNELTASPQPAAGTTTLAAPVIGNGQVTLSWAPVPGATGYLVRRGTAPGVYTSSTTLGAVSSTTVAGLSNGTTYYFAVAAVNGAGPGADSNERSAVPNVLPAAPDLGPAIAGDRQVSLSWPRAAGVTGFIVRWGTTPGQPTETRVFPTIDFAVIDALNDGTPLVNGTTYYFTLTSVNSAGAGPPSIERAATPSSVGTAAPTLTGAVAGDRSVRLSWTPVAGATGYTVRWGVSPGPLTDSTTVGAVDSTTIGAPLLNGTTYVFAVAARQGAAVGPESNQLVATPTGPALAHVPAIAVVAGPPAAAEAAAPPAPVPPGTGKGLLGAYYANPALRGRPLLTRRERIDFHWGTAAPASRVPRNGFSVRWTGAIEAPLTGWYEILANADDAVRVSIAGHRIVDTWSKRAHEGRGTIRFDAGRRYRITVEYRDVDGPAAVRLRWRFPGRSRPLVVSASRLHATLT